MIKLFFQQNKITVLVLFFFLCLMQVSFAQIRLYQGGPGYRVDNDLTENRGCTPLITRDRYVVIGGVNYNPYTHPATNIGSTSMTIRENVSGREDVGGFCATVSQTGVLVSNITVIVENPTFTLPTVVCSDGANINLRDYVVTTSGSITFTCPTCPAGAMGPANGTSFNRSLLSPNTTYEITCNISYSNGTKVIASTLSTNGYASITSNPSNVSVCGSGGASFSVGTNLAASYQWQESSNGGGNYFNISNTGVYSGTTTANLNISSVAGRNGYLYRCVVNGVCNSVISNAASISVFGTVPVTQSPINQTICPGGSANFSANGTAQSGSLSYQWQESANGSSWSNLSNGAFGGITVSGAGSSTLSLSSVTNTAYNGYYYRCIMTDGCGVTTQVASASARLFLYGNVTVTQNPINQSVCPGGSLNFTAGGTGQNGSVGYQWQYWSGGTWISLSNATYAVSTFSGVTTPTLTVTNMDPAYNGMILSCFMYDNCGNATASRTNNAVITVYSNVSITSHPANQSVCPNGNATFSIAATASNGSLTYQWQYEGMDITPALISSYSGLYGTNITGATTSTLNFSNVNPAFHSGTVRCVVRDACGSVTQAVSGVASLNVFSNLSITSQPVNRDICPGSSTTFSVTSAAQNGSLSYAWDVSSNGGVSWSALSNAGIYSGVTSATLTLTNATTAYQSYQYRVRVNDACGSVTAVTSNAATLTFKSPVVINTQPVAQSICPNGNASFTVAATAGNGSLSYQWQVSTNAGLSWNNVTNGGIYSGATASTLNLTSVTPAYTSYQYRAVVSDDCGVVNQVTSAPRLLIVYAGPSITSQPINTLYCLNGNTSFSVVASANTGSLSYQWQVSSNSGSTWTDLTNLGIYSGTSTSTLNLTGINNTYSGNQYRVRVTDGCGAATTINSNAVTLTQHTVVNITAQPPNRSICPNSNTTFTVTATASNGSPTYQWQVSTNGGSTWGNVTNTGGYSGATTATLSLTNVALSLNNYRYRAVINDLCGAVTQATSNVGVLTVYSGPSITTEPVNTGYCINSNASFSVVATASNGSLTYQWQVSTDNGVIWSNLSNVSIYSGVTTATLNLTNIPLSNTGYRYRVLVRDACGAVNEKYSAERTLTAFGAVAINTQPINRTICPAANTTFTVSATANIGSLTYQWQVSTNSGSTWSNVSNGGIYSGATAATLNLTAVPVGNNNYRYRVIVQDGCGAPNQTISSAVTLTVNNSISVTTQPVNTSICLNSPSDILVVASGTGLTYQWQESSNGGTTWSNLSNIGIYSGVTTATLSFSSVSLATNGYKYRVQIGGTCSNTVSSEATVSVVVPPSIDTDPVGTVVCQASNASFNVSASGSNLTYQWQYSANGNAGTYNDISGAVLAQYDVIGALPTNNGFYRVAVNNGCGGSGTISSGAQLTVTPITSISTQPSNAMVCPGNDVSISVVANGTGTITYQWQVSTNSGSTYDNVSGVQYSGVASATLTLLNATTAFNNLRYRVKINSDCGNEVISSASTLTVNPIPAIPTVTDVARCGTGSLSATASTTSPTPTFNWYLNESDVTPLQSGATYTVTSLTTTANYFVEVVSLTCVSEKKQVNFTRYEPAAVSIGGALTLCSAQGTYNLENDIVDPNAKGNNFTWTANGTNYSGKNFDPSVGLGIYVVSYDPPSNVKTTPNCYTLATRIVTVVSEGGSGNIQFNGDNVSNGNTINTCVGNEPIILSAMATPSGGTWSTVTGSGLSSSGSSTIFTPTQNNYTATTPNTFRYTVNVGGCSSSRDINVFVKDNQNIPVISGLPSQVCPSTILNLSASVTAPGSFLFEWTKSGQSAAFDTTALLVYPVLRNETFLVRSINLPFNCRSNAREISINTPFSLGNISASQTTINTGSFVKFNYETSITSNSYEWNFGDGEKSFEKDPAHYYFEPGIFNVKLKVFASLGCTEDITFGNITVNGEAIEIITSTGNLVEENDVFPNPAQTYISFRGSSLIESYTLLDLKGNVVANGLVKPGINTISIDNLPPGIYLFELKNSRGHSGITKIIKN